MALIIVILAYVLSLIIKCTHCYFYKPNLRQKNILQWKYFKPEDSIEQEIQYLIHSGDEQKRLSRPSDTNSLV